MDCWHPLEKAQYPHYFARRELRKLESVKFWESQYGKPAHQDAGFTHWQEYETEPATDEQKKYGPFTQVTPGAKEGHH